MCSMEGRSNLIHVSISNWYVWVITSGWCSCVEISFDEQISKCCSILECHFRLHFDVPILWHNCIHWRWTHKSMWFGCDSHELCEIVRWTKWFLSFPIKHIRQSIGCCFQLRCWINWFASSNDFANNFQLKFLVTGKLEGLAMFSFRSSMILCLKSFHGTIVYVTVLSIWMLIQHFRNDSVILNSVILNSVDTFLFTSAVDLENVYTYALKTNRIEQFSTK